MSTMNYLRGVFNYGKEWPKRLALIQSLMCDMGDVYLGYARARPVRGPARDAQDELASQKARKRTAKTHGFLNLDHVD